MNPLEQIDRYQMTGNLQDLEEGIAGLRRLVAREPTPELFSGLGNALSMRHDAYSRRADIEEAIDWHRRAVAALAGRPGLAEAQAQLAPILWHVKRREEAQALFEESLRGPLEDRSLVLTNYGWALHLAFMETGDRADLVRGLEVLKEAVETTDPGTDRYTWRLARYASALFAEVADPARRAELNAVLETIRQRYPAASEPVKRQVQVLVGFMLAMGEVPEIPQEGFDLLADLPDDLASMFGTGREGEARLLAMNSSVLIEDVRRAGEVQRAHDAVEMFRQALSALPDDSPSLPEILSGLGAVLGLRMEMTGTTDDLDEMVDALRRACPLARPGSDIYGMVYSDLGNSLVLKFRLGGGLAVLDEAVAAYRQAIALAPEHPEVAMAITGLGAALSYRYEVTGRLEELDESIAHHQAAVDRTAPDHVNYGLYLVNLGSALQARYEALHRTEDTEAAAAALRAAVAAVPDGSPFRPGYLASLGEVLATRYQVTGQSGALAEAVRHHREAAETIDPGNLQRPHVLNSLGRTLELSGADPAEAIDLFRTVRAAAQPGSSFHRNATVNLAGALLDRAMTGRASVRAMAELLTDLFDERPRRSRFLGLLGAHRAQSSDTPELDEAIELLSEAAKEDLPGASAVHSRLGQALRLRYQLTGEPRALTRALRTMRAAVNQTGTDGATRSVALYYLAETLRDQWQLSGDERARAESLLRYRQAAEEESASASWRATVGQRWGEFAMEDDAPADAAAGFGAAVAALDEAAWRGLGRADQERILQEFEGLGRDAAAAALQAGDPATALELLEQGRGVLLGQAMDSHTSLDLLRATAPALADRLAEIHHAQEAAERLDLTEGPDAPHRLDERPVLARRRRETLAEIRELPGFEDFLRPPSSRSLLAAAEDGPIAILNVSRYRCDALLVTTDGVDVLPLATTAEEAQTQADAFAEALDTQDLTGIQTCLDWLWSNVTGPVLEALGPSHRIWWCPTGPLTLLPLHAAGQALDRVISSYTPTLRALITARDRARGPRTARRMTLVGLAETPGASPLMGVPREIQAVTEHFPDVVELRDGDATHDQVMAALTENGWAHLACHAVQEIAEPAQARLLLHDRPLLVRELAAHRLDQAELAFLSGCETSRGGTVLADEAINIAASLQLAGFPHVIGTLWPISDIHAPAVAAEFYTVLTAGGTSPPDPTAAATALHLAVRSLRARRPDFPIFWAPYLHVGP
ncbi:CHAT domain-containing protein [Spirillospora sp. NPDC029432]|uniref:CHAT domain-containing protein n=1 Tax=Spirillospora sp. NPDC029432 TaxID=3154599 RepID=UPI0034555CEE